MAQKKAKSRKRKKAPEPQIRSQQETAKFFGITTPTVRAWIDDGCPVVEGGHQGVAYKLDLRAVGGWLKGREDDKARLKEETAAADAQLKLELLGGDALPDGAEGPLTPKQRADFLRAELDKVKLAEKRGELVHADAVRDVLSNALALVRERLRALPDQLARKFDLSEVQVVAALELTDEILADLADELAGMTAETEEAGHAEAA